MDSLTELQDARSNGHSADRPPDARGKRIANRTPWLSLPDPFDNLSIRAWLDYPQEVAELWTSPKDETPDQANLRVRAACKEVFLEHDGWEDDDGLLPGPETDEFWDRISTPLARAILTRFFEELSDSPLSRASRRKKARSFRKR